MTASAAAAPVAPQPARQMSSPARLIGALFSPGKTFADIGREPHFLLSLLVVLLCTAAIGFTMLQRIGAFGIARQQLAARHLETKVPADQYQQILARQANIEPYIMPAAPPVFTAIAIFVMAAICLGATNFALGQQLKYKQTLAIVTHAMMPVVVGSLIAIVIFTFHPDPSTIDINNPVGTNPGFYLDQSTTSPVLIAFLKTLDVFWLWALGLIGLGLSKAGRKLSLGAGLGVAATLWAIYALISTGTVALFS